MPAREWFVVALGAVLLVSAFALRVLVAGWPIQVSTGLEIGGALALFVLEASWYRKRKDSPE